MAVAHVVLTVLFYTGDHDTGGGYVFDWEWPAWLIVIINERTALGLILTLAASVMALARAAWMVFVPILLIVAVASSALRMVRRRPAPAGA